MPRSQLQLRRFPKDDRLPREPQIVGALHAIPAGFFAHDEEETDVPRADLLGSEQLLEGDDLGGDAVLVVDGAAAPDLVVAAELVGPEGGDGVDVAGEEDAGGSLGAGVGEEVESGFVVGFGC